MAVAPRTPEPPQLPAGMDPSPPDDAKSPTTIVLNFLRSKGMPATGQNIRTVLEQNAREPGYIPGLGNDAPGTDAKANAGPAKMPGAGSGRGGEKRTADAPVDRRGEGDPTTSAQPSAGMDLSSIGKMILGGGALGGAGYAANKYFGRDMPTDVNGPAAAAEPGAEFIGNKEMAPTGRQIDINGPAISAETRPMLMGPQGAIAGPASSPMQQALDRATALPGPEQLGQPPIVGAADTGKVMPFDAANVAAQSQQLPPGITDVDAARAAGGDLGRTGGPMNTMPVPMNSQAPRPPVQAGASDADLLTKALRLFTHGR